MKALVSALLLALLCGCASQETVFRPATSAGAQQDAPFAVSGRMSVQVDGKGQVANFDWSHAVERDELPSDLLNALPKLCIVKAELSPY